MCWRDALIGGWSVDHVSTLQPATYPDDPEPEPFVVYKVRRKRRTHWRQGKQHRAWRDAVSAGKHACEECGADAQLYAHHRSTDAGLRYDVGNGVMLCRPCHRAAHPELPSSLFA